MKQDYLRWMISKTKTTWWHDSADPAELTRGIERGAIGATTNPFLASLALHANKAAWAAEIQGVLAENPEPEKKAEGLMNIVVGHTAQQLLPQ